MFAPENGHAFCPFVESHLSRHCGAMRNKSARIGILSAVLSCALLPSAAADPPIAATPSTRSPETRDNEESYQGFFNNSSFLIVPIPISNPTVGSGGGVATAMFFKTDKDSKSSFIGAGSFYTSNGSWGAATLGDVSFNEGRYHARATAGYANVNYDFYGTRATNPGDQQHVSLNQSGGLFQAAFEGRVAQDFYVGGKMRYLTVKTKFKSPEIAGDLLDNDGPLAGIKNNVLTAGLTASYDSRDKDYSPSRGWLIQGGFDAGLNDFIAREPFLRATLSLNRYDTLATDLVLASHGSFCGEGGHVPIFDLCLFGSQNDLRGYAVGRYQDKTMFTVQEELRWRAFWRIGFVAFAGLGSVAPTINRFDKILYSGGGGIRFLASREYGVNIGIDGVVNAQGQATYYIQVGEAF